MIIGLIEKMITLIKSSINYLLDIIANSSNTFLKLLYSIGLSLLILILGIIFIVLYPIKKGLSLLKWCIQKIGKFFLIVNDEVNYYLKNWLSSSVEFREIVTWIIERFIDTTKYLSDKIIHLFHDTEKKIKYSDYFKKVEKFLTIELIKHFMVWIFWLVLSLLAISIAVGPFFCLFYIIFLEKLRFLFIFLVMLSIPLIHRYIRIALSPKEAKLTWAIQVFPLFSDNKKEEIEEGMTEGEMVKEFNPRIWVVTTVVFLILSVALVIYVVSSFNKYEKLEIENNVEIVVLKRKIDGITELKDSLIEENNRLKKSDEIKSEIWEKINDLKLRLNGNEWNNVDIWVEIGECFEQIDLNNQAEGCFMIAKVIQPDNVERINYNNNSNKKIIAALISLDIWNDEKIGDLGDLAVKNNFGKEICNEFFGYALILDSDDSEWPGKLKK